MTEPGHLKPKTVAIVFGAVGLAFVVVCLSVGAWELVVGSLIAIPLVFLVIFPLFRIAASVVIIVIGTMLARILPRRLQTFATERALHPAVVVSIFGCFFGVLLLIYRSLVGVLGGLAVVGVLIGLPWLAEWSRERSLKKKP